MKPAPFDYEAPNTIEEALKFLGEDDARPIAGGQSLAPMLALRLTRPRLLVDLNRIASLEGITARNGTLRIGAMTRQAAVLRSAAVIASAPILSEALRHVGHPPTRVRGTIGGSLAHADPAAELPVAMVALGATMHLTSMSGERQIRANDFFRGAFETALRPDEVLTSIDVPSQEGGAAFLEISPRRGDFAIVSIATRVAHIDGLCTSCSVVFGGIGDRPVRCTGTEAELIGHPIADAIGRAADALPIDAVTMESRVASTKYRRRLMPILFRRAIAISTSKGKTF